MAFTIKEALKEMANGLEAVAPPKEIFKPLVKSKPTSAVEKFLIPESYMSDQPKLIGTLTADYWQLKEKFGFHAEFPENPVLSDAYASWKDVEVSNIPTEDEGDTTYVSVEVVFFDKGGSEVGKMYAGSNVTWEVYMPAHEIEYYEKVKEEFNKQYTPLKLK